MHVNTRPDARRSDTFAAMSSEGTTDTAPPRPARPNTWASAVRPPPPDGFRYSHRWILVPEADVLTRGRNSRVWGYNARTLSRLLGITTAKLQQAINAGQFQPADLGSVIRWTIEQMRPGDPKVGALPPLWRAYDGFTMLSISKAHRGATGTSKLIPLAVQMPTGPDAEEVVRSLWGHRAKLRGFNGSANALARLLLELDGIDPAEFSATHRCIAGVAKILLRLVKHGVLTLDAETKLWGWAPFPSTLAGVLDGLRSEGFQQAEIVGRHIAIERDLYSFQAAHRLLSYMRTNRVRASACGRDLRLWIICNMDRVMHGYKQRRIFRRSTTSPDAPAGSGPRP